MLLDTRYPSTTERPFKYGRYSFKFKPLYCDMGYGDRAETHAKKARKPGAAKSQKNIRIRNIQKTTGADPAIRYLKTGLTQHEAFALERKFIKLIGRQNLGTGPLTNLSDGGEGQKNVVHTVAYREQRSTTQALIWSRRSMEDVERILMRMKAARDSWSPETRSEISARMSALTAAQMRSRTPEQKAEQIAKIKASQMARSSEERAAISARISTSRRRFFDSLSEAEYFEFQANVAATRAKTWAAKSAEEKTEIRKLQSRGMKEHWVGLSEAARTEVRERRSQGISAMSDEAKKIKSIRISLALRAAYELDPSIKIRAGAASSKTCAARTKKEKADHSERCRQSNRSHEHEVRAKMSRSGKLRVACMSEDELAEQSRKFSEAQHRAWDKATPKQRAMRCEALAAAHRPNARGR